MEHSEREERMRAGYVPSSLAAHLLGKSEKRLKELADQGALRRFGNPGGHGYYSLNDIEHMRGRAVDDRDIEFAHACHQRRLESYARSNAKRRFDAYQRENAKPGKPLNPAIPVKPQSAVKTAPAVKTPVAPRPATSRVREATVRLPGGGDFTQLAGFLRQKMS